MEPTDSSFIPDEPSAEDYLDFTPYVTALKDQVSSPKTKTPMVLGIFGSWGSGKTTLMKLLEKEIVNEHSITRPSRVEDLKNRGKITLSRLRNKRPDDWHGRSEADRVETLWINVWELNNQTELWNGFLQSLLTKVHAKLPYWRKLKFDWQLLRERIDLGELIRQLVINSYRIVIVITPLLLAQLWPLGGTQSPTPANASELAATLLNPITGGAATVVLGIVLLLKPIVEAARDKTSIDLKKVIKDAPFEAQVTALQKLQSQFRKMVQAWVGDKGRLIIFVDDIDRCSPDKVAEVLEALKLFATTDGCIYILGADQRVVARAIQVKYKELASSQVDGSLVDGMRYLEKIIQLPFLLPLVEVKDINIYLESFRITWPHPGVTDSFSRGLPANPRTIKRAVNVYLLLWRLAEERKRLKKTGGIITPLRLAKVVALQTAYSDAFEQLRERPEVLKALEEYSQKSLDEQRTVLEDSKKIDPLLLDLARRPFVTSLFGLQKDDPLALFKDLDPSDLRAFFSLAGQVAVLKTETPERTAAAPKINVRQASQTESTVRVPATAGMQAMLEDEVLSAKDVHIQPATLREALSLHQLPAPPRDFVDRENEIAQAMDVIGKGAGILAIHGIAGIGKTAFALTIAEKLVPSYPDAQIFLDLRGTGDRHLATSEIIIHAIRAYYPLSMRFPDSELELRELYQSVLMGKRVLLLMDDAADIKQLQPVLPPAGCLLLITSRQLFTLPGQHSIILETLPPTAAREMLLTIAPRIDVHADKLAEVSGYVPLALRLNASTLAERIDVNPEKYIAQLTSNGLTPQTGILEGSLALSYNQLRPESQELLLILSVFPDTFSWEAVSTVWDRNSDEVLPALSELLKHSLLEWYPVRERYRMNALVKSFAGNLLDLASRKQRQRRLAKYYLAVLQWANFLYVQGGEAFLQGLALYDLEVTNIKAGQSWSSEHALEDKAIGQLCSAFPRVGTEILRLRQYPSERIKWLDAALDVARQYRIPEDEVSHLINLGLASADLGNNREAVSIYENALSIARKLVNRKVEGTCLNNLGLVYQTLGQLDKAKTFCHQALDIIREAGDRAIESGILNNLGLVYRSLGQMAESLDFYQQALMIMREIGDRVTEGTTLNNLGAIYDALGQKDKALDFYQQALAIHREVGNRSVEGTTLNNLGTVYDALGQKDKALDFYQQALTIFRDVGDRSSEGTTLNNIGQVYYAIRQMDKALDFYQQALVIHHKVGNRPMEGTTLNNIAGIYYTLGKMPEALDFYRQALAIHREIGNRSVEGTTLNNIGSVYDDLDQKDKALDFYQQALNVAREVGDRSGEGTTLNNIGRVYADLGQKAKALDFYQQALTSRREVGDRSGEGTTLNNLGGVYDDLGQKDKALDFYQQALAIRREVGDRFGESVTLFNIGLLLDQMGRTAEAVTYLEQNVALDEAIGHPDLERDRAILERVQGKLGSM